MSRKQTVVIAVLLLIAAGAIYGWKEYHRKNADLSTVATSYTVEANALIREFDNNDSAATKKYLGKIITVEGLIKKIDQDEDKFYTVILGDTLGMSSIRCAMDAAYATDAARFQPMSSAKIKGYFTGYEKDETGLLGSDVKLSRCVVVKNN